MTNRERIEKGLEKLPVETYIFSCQKCGRIGSHKKFDECPICGGKIQLVEMKTEIREVILACCSNKECNRLVPKNIVECPDCGADTVPVLSQEGQGLAGIFSN